MRWLLFATFSMQPCDVRCICVHLRYLR